MKKKKSIFCRLKVPRTSLQHYDIFLKGGKFVLPFHSRKLSVFKRNNNVFYLSSIEANGCWMDNLEIAPDGWKAPGHEKDKRQKWQKVGKRQVNAASWSEIMTVMKKTNKDEKRKKRQKNTKKDKKDKKDNKKKTECWEAPGQWCKLIRDNDGHVLAAEGTTLASVSQDRSADSQGE